MTPIYVDIFIKTDSFAKLQKIRRLGEFYETFYGQNFEMLRALVEKSRAFKWWKMF